MHWLPLATAVATFAAIGNVYAQPLADAPLVKALRQGGYVLVMRHARSPTGLPDKTAVDPENVTGERQLDETGRNTARAMGEAIKTLRIPIADVQSSPTYRALETVRLASLGIAKPMGQLNAGGQNMMQTGADEVRSAWLKRRVAESPPAGSNTVIVTHAPNMLGAFGSSASDLSDGETLVFRPDGKGAAALVARVKIEKWPHLTERKHAQEAR
jgi:phosphohistidine phosphatase SixA